MAHLANDPPSSVHAVVHPRVCWKRSRVHRALNGKRLADCRTFLLDPSGDAREPPVEPHHEDGARWGGAGAACSAGANDFFELLAIHCEGLFDKHMLAMTQGFACELGVRAVAGGNDNQMDFGIFDKSLIVGCAVVETELLRDMTCVQ